ncbi:hypothetical protein CLOP_g24748 [Closterium sp. NIES-67]|nr:hypothetical protein CLOP_g24748 [Closterium sp. NIES-67]
MREASEAADHLCSAFPARLVAPGAFLRRLKIGAMRPLQAKPEGQRAEAEWRNEAETGKGRGEGTRKHRVTLAAMPSSLRPLVLAAALVAASAAALLGWSPLRPTACLPPPAAASAVQIPLGAPEAKPLGRLSKRARLLYWLDNLFATEPNSKALTLLAICMLLTAVGGLLYKAAAVASNDDLPLGESVWVSWTFVSNPSEHVNEATGPKRVVSAVVSVGGMLFFALLVGLATDLVASKVDQLEQGNGAVIESNHTLVCGWTPKTIPLVRALVEAGERPSVVVLADRETQEMDGELLEAVPVEERGGMRVMTRHGDPLKAADLNRCSASQAASIVILSPQLPSRHQADAQVLQTAMALAVLPEIQGDVVAELACPENTMLLGQLHASLMKRLDRARQQHMVGSSPSSDPSRIVTHAGSAATAIASSSSPSTTTTSATTTAATATTTTTAKINPSTITPDGTAAASALPSTTNRSPAVPAAPASRARAGSRAAVRRRKLVPVETGGMALRRLVDLALQPAGSAVAAEMLSFKGAEFHFKEWRELEGRTFAEAMFLFEDAVPCGVQQMVGTEDERTLINPPGDTVIEPGDRLLVIAESADSYAPRKPTAESAKERELVEKRMASFATPWHYDSLPRGNVRRRHNVLIAGEWRDDVAEALLLLGAKLAPRSQVAVMVDSPSLSAAQQRLNPFMKPGGLNLNLSLYHGHLGSMADLEKVPLEAFDTVIVLAPRNQHPSPPDQQQQQRRDDEGTDRGDSYSSSSSSGSSSDGGDGVLMPSASVTAMMIRTIQKERGQASATLLAESDTAVEGRGEGGEEGEGHGESESGVRPAAVVEGGMLDEVQQKWLNASVDTNVVHARILAHTAMDPDVGGVLDEIVSGSGSSLSLEDATSFLVDGEALSFFDLQSRVLRRRKLMIAYNCANNGGKWQLNPQDKNTPLMWRTGDRLVVLS